MYSRHKRFHQTQDFPGKRRIKDDGIFCRNDDIFCQCPRSGQADRPGMAAHMKIIVTAGITVMADNMSFCRYGVANAEILHL